MPTERQLHSEDTISTLVQKIASTPHHDNFPAIYERFKPSFRTVNAEKAYLQCVLSYISMDSDRDGIRDWKISSDEQLFSHLLPLDDDWDNDGVLNLFDKAPTKKSKKNRESIPPHLRLAASKNSILNALQDKIYSKCHVLALHHTDTHSEANLSLFLDVCTPALATFKNKPYNFVLYAFSSHSIKGDIVASFYAESNFMSIGGELFESKNKENLKLTIAHEIGHYFTFNYLTPKELAVAAARFGKWGIANPSPTSFFDPQFLKPSQTEAGFFPSLYARTNIHEWFGEVFANFLYKRSLTKTTTLASHTPEEVDQWISDRLDFH